MIETSSVPSRKSSQIFAKCPKSVRKRSPYLRKNFGISSKIFGNRSEIFGKSSKTSSLVCLCNKQNIRFPLCGYEFYLLVFNSTSSWTLEDKIHIHARSCNILYICYYHKPEKTIQFSVQITLSTSPCLKITNKETEELKTGGYPASSK